MPEDYYQTRCRPAGSIAGRRRPGNERLRQREGSIWWKFPWWRLVSGDLTITGRRLDAPAPPLKSFVPEGYGEIGFQASGVTFPSEGCWQLTGTVAHSSLTFVTLVIPQAHRAVISGSG